MISMSSISKKDIVEIKKGNVVPHYICQYDDEVSRVCKTPGDPCGCTRQNSQRSGLPLSSPWINTIFCLKIRHFDSEI